MPRGDKSKYTDKQKREAQHIEESYEKRGVPAEEAMGAPGRRSINSTAVATEAAPGAALAPLVQNAQ